MLNFEKEILVFAHVPKCAGSSLNAALAETVGPSKFVRLRMQKIENVRTSRAAELGVLAHETGLKALSVVTGRHYLLPKHVRKGQVEKAKVVSGHFCIGQEPDTGRRPHYMSLVRSPVDRFLSYYYYRINKLPRLLRNKSHHPLLNKDGCAPATPIEYLDQLVASGAKNWRNPQVRYFSPEGTFEAAREAIEEKNVLVSTTLEFEAFLDVVAKRIGVESVPMKHKNVGRTQRRARHELSAADREVIAEHFDEDRKLFEYVADRVADGALRLN
jgi:hypothetical protein